MVRAFGARVEEADGAWRVTGTGGKIAVPDNVVDVGNSGTSLYIGLGIASLVDGNTVFTGDHQIRSRPAGGLIDCINELGGSGLLHQGQRHAARRGEGNNNRAARPRSARSRPST